MTYKNLLKNWKVNKVQSGHLVHANCFEVLNHLEESSIHAIVTDPPYGVKEFDLDQLNKMQKGKGGIWRISPSFDGNVRSPLPRFTALNAKEKKRLEDFFVEWSRLAFKSLRPGGHLFLASNSFLSNMVFTAVASSGLEFRGEVIRLVRTLRGGDRPKNHETEFPDVCSMPRGCYEPWGFFRKPLPPKMTVAQCLCEFGTGGLQRKENGNPFEDVIESERTPQAERELAEHPSVKPQSFMRKIVRAALPMGEGVILDPFMGAGTTIAAANFLGIDSIGIEKSENYYNVAMKAVPQLSKMYGKENLSKATRTQKDYSPQLEAL